MDKIKEWLSTTPYKNYELTIASADASFRQYFRLKSDDKTVLLMDSSLEKDSLSPFLDLTSRLLDVGVKAPLILEQNLQHGFLILEDFGNTHYLDILDDENFSAMYKTAIDVIIKMQIVDVKDLPVYDKKFLHFEMDLMQKWYFEGLLKKSLSISEKNIIQTTLENISTVVLCQPQNIFVHRDFHSRNIMIQDEKNIGVIDYQDAMNGAVTYDLVSLLKDCYINFDVDEINKLALYFRDKKALNVSDAEFIKWFDFMGLQRHIKVLGIFSRLYLRDGKKNYLKDIPLTLQYVFDTSKKYEETKALTQLLKDI